MSPAAHPAGWHAQHEQVTPPGAAAHSPLQWRDVSLSHAGRPAGYLRLCRLDHTHRGAREYGAGPWAILEADPEAAVFAPLYFEGYDAPDAFTAEALAAARAPLDHPGSIGHHTGLLMLIELGVYPAHRGRDAARWLVAEAVRAYAPEGGLVALSPYPLQCLGAVGAHAPASWRARDRRMRLAALPADAAAGVRKLRSLYSAWGFQPVLGEALMVAAPDHLLDRLAAATLAAAA